MTHSASGPWGVGELFPLPLPEVEPPPHPSLSRGTRQRVSRRRTLTTGVRGTVAALNWLAGCEGSQPSGDVMECHKEVWADVTSAHAGLSGAPVLVPGEASRALLRHKAGYGLEDSTLRPFQKDLVALPEDACAAPFAADLLEPSERMMLEGLTGRLLKSDAELEGTPEVVPYMDPVLRHDRSKYVGSCRCWHSVG